MIITLKFYPQKWVNDYAYPCEPLGVGTWQVDSSLIDFDFEEDHYKRDCLRFEGDAPQWIRDWSGPFEVDSITDLDSEVFEGIDYPEEVENCPTHLESCDDDGYCNYCGEQASDEDFE